MRPTGVHVAWATFEFPRQVLDLLGDSAALTTPRRVSSGLVRIWHDTSGMRCDTVSTGSEPRICGPQGSTWPGPPSSSQGRFSTYWATQQPSQHRDECQAASYAPSTAHLARGVTPSAQTVSLEPAARRPPVGWATFETPRQVLDLLGDSAALPTPRRVSSGLVRT